ncbi:MAG TPA: Crp/Fnr family transcriptional regulator [Terriglobia bacterium]|nr:Crp/Fnr family transcriptional regulator [Terriglobia bacterium]
MARKNTASIEPEALLANITRGKSALDLRNKQAIFSQGDLASALFYIQKGAVKLTVISRQGREAVIGILERGSFFGESCLMGGQPMYMMTASAMGSARVLRIEKQSVLQLIEQDPKFSEFFIFHLVLRMRRIQEDLIDQLFNPAEKRLARVLLLLAHFGKDGEGNEERQVIPKVSQETLARMIGADRSRVSSFMNKFKKSGFIDYSRGLRVRSSLRSVILQDQPPGPRNHS